MVDYTPLYNRLAATALRPWIDALPDAIADALQPGRHGDWQKWQAAIAAAPVYDGRYRIDDAVVSVGKKSDLSPADWHQFKALLETFIPWRKGPYRLFDIDIDTEWRSDLKWDRLAGHISPLKNRLVLDIGCGNGYHCWRMAADSPQVVIGIDPFMLYYAQYCLIRRLIPEPPVFVLPLGTKALPGYLSGFDSIFSMGVLYHLRSPIDHLRQMRQLLAQQGELILETLVIDGDQNSVLLPEGRYAKMRNVWFIPSCKALELWLKRCGFENVRLIDVSRTLPREQRRSEWMPYESLSDFLDPKDDRRTIEGYPAPKRAIFIAGTGS